MKKTVEGTAVFPTVRKTLRQVDDWLAADEEALEAQELYRTGQVAESLEMLLALKARRLKAGDIGTAADMCLSIAVCLDALNQPVGELASITEAVKLAELNEDPELLLRVRTDYARNRIKNGSLRQSCALLNHWLRSGLLNHRTGDTAKLLYHLGNCYLALNESEWASSCFQKAYDIVKEFDDPQFMGLLRHSQARAALSPAWRLLLARLLDQPALAPRVTDSNSREALELFKVIDADAVRIGHPHLEFMNQYMKIEHLRAKVIEGKIAEVRMSAPPIIEWYSQNQPGSFAPVHINQVIAVAELLAERPDAAARHLRKAFLKVTGEQSIMINLISHSLLQLAYKQSGQYREAVSQAEEAEILMLRQSGPNSSDLEHPYFLAHSLESPQSQSSPTVTTPSEVLQAALQLIRDKLHEPITVTFIARSLHLSVRTLQQLFRSGLGATPREVLLHMRLDLARNMLLDDSQRKSIQEISEEVGISRTASFARQYQKRFGEMPSKTRNRKKPLEKN